MNAERHLFIKIYGTELFIFIFVPENKMSKI